MRTRCYYYLFRVHNLSPDAYRVTWKMLHCLSANVRILRIFLMLSNQAERYLNSILTYEKCVILAMEHIKNDKVPFLGRHKG